MSSLNVNEVVDTETGEVLENHEGMIAPVAGAHRLNEDGSEKLCSLALVCPLSRPPSLEARIERMVKSGELAEAIRREQAMRNEDDDDFEGYDRNYEDEYVPTHEELVHAVKILKKSAKASNSSPQADDGPSGTPEPDVKSQAASAAPSASQTE